VLTDRTGATTRALEARRRLEVQFSVEDWVGRYRTIYERAAGSQQAHAGLDGPRPH
jgi:hypothetical protein